MADPKLKLIIVGAGLAGLTCAISAARHSGVEVTILEKAEALENAGNGIQVPCNAASVLKALGLLDKLFAKANGPAKASLSLNYKDGKVLLDRDWTRCKELYGVPWLLVHRADYMDILLGETRRLGVEMKLGCEVDHVNCETTSLTLTTGETYNADVIVGCDGLHSKIRKQLHPTSLPHRSGAHAYRALFTIDQIPSCSSSSSTCSTGAHPFLQQLGAEIAANETKCRLWLGPGAHAVFYPVRAGSILNLVLVVSANHPHSTKSHASSGEEALAALVELTEDWDPAIREMLAAAKETIRFPLFEAPALLSWSRGSIVLAGDAVHPMLPCLGQGAAIAAEDAYILGTLLGLAATHLTSPSPYQIGCILNAYEKLQKPRAGLVVRKSKEQADLNHLLPGDPKRVVRDGEYAAFEPETCVSEGGWVDAAFNKELLGRRVEDVVKETFESLFPNAKLNDDALKP